MVKLRLVASEEGKENSFLASIGTILTPVYLTLQTEVQEEYDLMPHWEDVPVVKEK